jgi:hypothetical protein
MSCSFFEVFGVGLVLLWHVANLPQILNVTIQWWSAIIEFFGFFRFYFFNFFRTSFCVLHWKFPRVAATEYCGKKPKNSIIADHQSRLPTSIRFFANS